MSAYVEPYGAARLNASAAARTITICGHNALSSARGGGAMALESVGKQSRPSRGLTPAQLRVVVTLGFCGLVSAADNWFVSPALPAIANTLAVLPTAAIVWPWRTICYGIATKVLKILQKRPVLRTVINSQNRFQVCTRFHRGVSAGNR